jgi:hypothetical protein
MSSKHFLFDWLRSTFTAPVAVQFVIDNFAENFLDGEQRYYMHNTDVVTVEGFQWCAVIAMEA